MNIELAIDHYRAGRVAEAQEICERILEHLPNQVDALHLLGVMAAQVNQYEKATYLIKRAIEEESGIADLHNSLGNVFLFQGSLEEAKNCYQRAIVLNPNAPEAYHNLGNIFFEQAELAKAAKLYQQAVKLNPNYAEAYAGLGNVLRVQGRFSEAATCYQEALRLAPKEAKIHSNLGITRWQQNQVTEAVACYQQALKLAPNFADAYYNLALALKDQGKLAEALHHYRLALAIEPHRPLFYTGFLLALHYLVDCAAATIFEEHRKFNEQLALPLAAEILPHGNQAQPRRRLKIGYVSSDFRKHSVAYFIAPILTQHDAHQFEIFCYYDHLLTDEVTSYLQAYAHHWLNCKGLSDEALTAKIRQDEIDILVDLMGHTSYPRLLVFARKPAPVQVTYLGYPCSTGLTAIDYRLTDKYVDDHFNSETPVQLPHSLFCYQPYAGTPPVNELPALLQGHITFSSFNFYPKISSLILGCWAEVLQRVPGAKLLVKTKSLQDESTRKDLETRLLQLGIEPDRWEWEGAMSPPDYLKSYHRVDIALDTYPFNGGTTTCEALWMGIPVVTLVGERQVARLGLSILSTIGLTDLIAYTSQEYVNKCVKLANDLEYLQHFRREVRDQMQQSPLMNAAAFTRDLETAYRHMWEQWCNNAQPCSQPISLSP